MKCAAAISEHPVAANAVGEVAGDLLERLGPDVDALFVFATESHAGTLEDIAPALRTLLNPKVMLGCLGDGIVGPEQEVSGSPALAVWAARGCEISAFRIETSDEKQLAPLQTAVKPGDSIILLADPRTYSPERLFLRMNELSPPVAVVGGYSSCRRSFTAGRLIMDGRLIDGGAVAAVMRAEPGSEIAHTVAQGARPVGSPLVVTESRENVIYKLGGAPALSRLSAMLRNDLSPDDLGFAGEGLLIGRVVEEHQETFGVGDFAVGPLIGTDPCSGSVTVSGPIPVGAIVQFHIRDELTANLALTRSLLGKNSCGALMFTSTSRGYDMFDEPSHDAIAVADLLGSPALAGLMTSAEFGPLAGVNVVNGLTAALALFGPSTG